VSARVVSARSGPLAASAARWLRRHAAIGRQFARIGVLRKSQFRVEFLSQVLMDCFWYGTKIGVFEALFQYTRTIAGWTAAEVRVFLGFLFVADSFMMMWLGMRWRFARELKDGKLDPLRVRPASPVFLYFFQQFSLEAAFNMAVAFGYLAFGLVRGGFLGSPATWIALPPAIALAWWCIVVTTVLFAIADLWVLNSDLGVVLSQSFDTAAVQPLDVFTAKMKAFLLFLVPVGVMTYVPASVVVGKMSWETAALHAAWMVGFGLLTFRAWRLSFRRYESAMS
jgi:ABC-2 type transport system permease protein